jgi:glycine oxidase
MRKIIGAMSGKSLHRLGHSVGHCVVLGAGLMGRLLACELAGAGHRVSLYAAGSANGDQSAAWVAAAMLAPLAESAITEPVVVRMGQYSLNRWPELLAKLSLPVFFQQQGTLILWHRQDAGEASRFTLQIDFNHQRINGLPAPQTVNAAQINALEPSLGHRFAQGLYLPGEGQLDNRALLHALLEQLRTLGVATQWQTPCSPGDFSPTPDGTVQWVFDCRGLGARPQMPLLRGVRGEVVRVHAPELALTRPVRLIHPRYPIYIAPKPRNVYVIGATEIESDDDSPASVRSTLELLSAAYSVHSGFAEARILEINTQRRPALPDNLPTAHQSSPRVIHINGLYRHGFLTAPALLDVVMEMVDQGESALATQFGLAQQLKNVDAP